MASDPSTTADSSSSITEVKALLSKSSLRSNSGIDTDESSTINNKESNDTNVLHKEDLIYDKSDQSNAAVNASISNNSSCFKHLVNNDNKKSNNTDGNIHEDSNNGLWYRLWYRIANFTDTEIVFCCLLTLMFFMLLLIFLLIFHVVINHIFHNPRVAPCCTKTGPGATCGHTQYC